MIRIQLHLTERQDRLLRALARRAGSTRAVLIRQGIDRLLGEQEASSDPLLELVGAAGKAGRPDLGQRHDDIVYDLPPKRAGTSRVAEGHRRGR
jgi:hypothetical protein